jgi:hypothetical protein
MLAENPIYFAGRHETLALGTMQGTGRLPFRMRSMLGILRFP